ncbi:Bifunctional protein FolD 4, chloroplastic-like protein [Drosera capensis]
MRGSRSRALWATIRKTTSSSSPYSSSQPSATSAAAPIESGRYLGQNRPDVWARGSVSGPVASIPKYAPSATIIDGKAVAAGIRSQVASEIERMKSVIGKNPGLAVVLVGKRSDSHSFVRIKMKACNNVGIASFTKELPEDCSEDEIVGVVSELNKDPSIHGIIVQLPLPNHLDEERILSFVSPEKDVDGFHPLNMGNLAMKGRQPMFIPCAAKACMEVLLSSCVKLTAKNAVVIGRSKIVGLPISMLLQRHHATVSVVHSFTKNPQELTCEADIVITDIGVPEIVRGSWLKPGAVVIDTGTNAVKDPEGKNGFRLAGDVCYEEAVRVASFITPVPGGLGPVTISMLLSNTLDSAKHAYRFA